VHRHRLAVLGLEADIAAEVGDRGLEVRTGRAVVVLQRRREGNGGTVDGGDGQHLALGAVVAHGAEAVVPFPAGIARAGEDQGIAHLPALRGPAMTRLVCPARGATATLSCTVLRATWMCTHPCEMSPRP